MFNTDRRVRLSDFNGFFGTLVRDAQFFSVAKIPSRLSARLVPITSEKYLPELNKNLADISAVLCKRELIPNIPMHLGCATSNDPLLSCFRIHERLHLTEGHFWTDFDSRIAPTAEIHQRAYVASKNVIIGDNCTIGANASVLERSILGPGCHIGCGVVIGCEAFEVPMIEGRNRLHPQSGGVRLGMHVVMCSNSSIAKSSFPSFTEIGEACMLDNHVHVAHDCIIEPGSTLTHGSLLAGRVHVKAGAYIGPNAAVSNGLTIGKKSKVSIGSTVATNVGDGAKVTGNFAIDHDRFIKNLKSSIS
jgi:UDP-3-O-[3-hydroxymyristoyl] glucosamine N-acyltransferase